MEATFTARLADYRILRRDIETNVLPLASSVDGRSFTLQAPVEALRLRVGGYVALDSPGASRLGQVLSLSVVNADAGELGWSGETTMSTRVRIRLVQGEGVVLDGPPDPFHDVGVRPAEPDEVRAWLHAAAPERAVLRAGELASPRGWCTASTRAGSTATRSCAVSRARARPTRSACCSSNCCWRRA